ncbi:MAG TPA: hypothetical protein PLU64_17975, partial [Saprospiraceae bacterium]|nr:hypothetical protein [Saprospiraceae bacterium]
LVFYPADPESCRERTGWFIVSRFLVFYPAERSKDGLVFYPADPESCRERTGWFLGFRFS